MRPRHCPATAARVVVTALVTAAAPAGLRAQEPDSALQAGMHLVAMVNARVDGAESFGAGIVFGRDRVRDHIYIATANHVVRTGEQTATDIRIRFRSHPDLAVPAVLTDHFDASRLDLAVLRIDAAAARDVAFCALPLSRLAERDSVRRGAAVYPVGQPVGASWGAPVAPDLIAQVIGDEITFQSAFVSAGHSGGALLTAHGEVAGMIRRDQPPFGTAVAIDAVLQALATWGYPVHLRRPAGMMRTPLHIAAERGDTAGARTLLEGCASDELDDTGWTPLHIAAARGDGGMVALLLDAGAGVDARTDDHPEYHVRARTALHLAAASGSVAAVRALLEHGADVNAAARDMPVFPATRSRGTALHFAVAAGSLEIIALLLRAGADIEASAVSIGTPLSAAAEFGRADVVRHLLAAGASVEGGRESPLHAAARNGRVAVLRVLIEARADLEAVRGSDRTALHEAAYAGHADAVRLLLDSGARRDALDSQGYSPLHQAARAGKLEAARVLLQKGADANLRGGRDGWTPLSLVPAEADELRSLIRSFGGGT